MFSGVVEISPSRVAPVCQVGDELELTCTVAGIFLRWEFTAISESGSAVVFMPTVTSVGTNGVPQPLTVNSTMFTFTRLSAQNNLPLISRKIINSVGEGLNGVEVNCVDVAASESAGTTIRIIDNRGRKF